MRHAFRLLSLCLVTLFALAPAAMAQEGAGPEGEGPCTGTFEQYIPEVNGCVLTEGSSNPGQSTVFDADTDEPIGTLDEVNAEIEAGETEEDPQNQQGNPYCEDDQFIATPPGSLGEGGLRCFDTQEEADIYAATGEIPQDDSPSASSEQYTNAETANTDTQAASVYTTLPDTGGTSLGVFGVGAGLILVVGGSLLKRRSA